MALTRIKTDNITDDKVTIEKLADGAVGVDNLLVDNPGSILDGQVLTATATGIDFTTVIPLGMDNANSLILKMDIASNTISTLDTVSNPLPAGWSSVSNPSDPSILIGHDVGHPPVSVTYYSIDPDADNEFVYRVPNSTTTRVLVADPANFGSEFTLFLTPGVLGIPTPSDNAYIMIMLTF